MKAYMRADSLSTSSVFSYANNIGTGCDVLHDCANIWKQVMIVLVWDRLDKILRMLEENQVIPIHAIAQALYISESTARRDLIALENKGMVRRIHGGVVSASRNRDVPISLRQSESLNEKYVIAAKAAAQVKPGEIIMLDSSTTCNAMVRFLPENSNLLVITSGLKTAIELSERHIQTLVTGGMVMDNSYSLVGYYANQVVNDMMVNKAFLSCRGISADGRISGVMLDEIQLRLAMARHAKQVIILLAANRINQEHCYTLGQIEDVDEIICDCELPNDWLPRIGLNRRKAFMTLEDIVNKKKGGFGERE